MLASMARQIVSKLIEFVINPSAVRWLGTTLDGQTNCFKIDRICLSVANPSSLRWLGTTLDGQTDCFKMIEFVCPSSTGPQSSGLKLRSTARQISQKVQNLSVRGHTPPPPTDVTQSHKIMPKPWQPPSPFPPRDTIHPMRAC